MITPLRNDHEQLIGFAKVTRDMTDRRRLEEKLRRSNDELDQRVKERTAELERAIVARDEFMSIASHELRTPITSLSLQVQTATRQLDQQNRERFHQKAEKFVLGASRQLEKLSRLIEDMFDVSRISVDKLDIEFVPINLGDVLREVVDRFEDQASAARMPIALVVEADPVVSGDRGRLEQVFSNLIMTAANL